MNIRTTIIPIVAILSGCAANSGVVSTGGGGYFISKQAATGFTGMGTLKADAMREAGSYCESQGKKARITAEHDAQPPFVLGNFPKTEIRFVCE